MITNRIRRSRRSGAIAVLAAFLLIPAFIFVAFVVNLGYILLAKEEMQKAADAAAMAGAAELFAVTPTSGGSYTSTETANNVARAVLEAQRFAVANTAGGTHTQLSAGDCIVGYIDPTVSGSPLIPWSAGQPYPNSVQVTIRRDGSINGPLQLFMGGILGMPTWNGHASATASKIYTITGFNNAGSLLLPLAIDVNLWNTFLATGKSPDGQVHDSYNATSPSSSTPPPGNVKSGSDGTPEFGDVYPNKTSPGNFGLVSLGAPSSNTPAYDSWVLNGATAADLAYFGPNGIQATPSAPLTMSGGPGMKDPVIGNLASIVGQSREILLYSSYADSGSNSTYQIVGFAGVTIVQSTGNGTKADIRLQPMNVSDPTGTPGGNSNSHYVTLPVALVR